MSNDNIQRRGLMLVLSSPSGAGKTTLSRRLLASDDAITMSVSCTTRAPRSGEEEGKDYFFVSLQHVHPDGAGRRLPGTRPGVRQSLRHAQGAGDAGAGKGRDVLFDIDWQGTQQLRQQAGDDLVSIFVLPPSHEELERRLRARAQDAEDVVQARMAKANNEISHWAEYDYVVINDDLESTLAKIRTILDAERMRRGRQTGIADFVGKLMS